MFAKNIFKFVQMLRHMGFKISYSEMEDFFQSIEHINLSKKEELKWLMQATLVKREQDLQVFQMAFDNFFASEAHINDFKERWQKEKEQQMKSKEQAEEDLIYNQEPVSLTEEEQQFYAQLSLEQQEKIKKFLEESTHGKHMHPERFRPVIEDIVKSHLKYCKKNTQFNPLEVDFTGDPDIDQYLFETHRQMMEQGYVPGKDLKDLNAKELEEAKRLLKKLAKRFATKISRRYALSKRAKKVDIRKTIRGNITYGGVPLKLKYRKRRLQKPSILLIVDVSGSMIRYSSFIIQFIYYLSEVVKKIDTFIFSEHLQRLTDKQTSSTDLFQLEKIVEGSPLWGEGTDLHHALTGITGGYRGLLTKKTVMIIVSDTKTLKMRESAAALLNVKEKVRDVLWLNPLPKKQWAENVSVSLFQEYSQMFPCNTLHDLEQLVSKKII